jgi:DNA (cytosine-5)-methyltransferase 1
MSGFTFAALPPELNDYWLKVGSCRIIRECDGRTDRGCSLMILAGEKTSLESFLWTAGQKTDIMSSDMPITSIREPANPWKLLMEIRQFMTQRMLAEKVKVSSKTISRWQKHPDQIPLFVEPALREILRGKPGNAENESKFTFIDLFAGIGGMRAGFEAAGGRCVFTSEWNKWSQITYRENFGNDSIAGDITKVGAGEIPDHDVLLAGFPCQPFSIAGVSKKNALGRPHGFECTTQGTLFFDVERIIAAKRPKAFLLENVKNLLSHDHGNTFKVIHKTLTQKLGYHVEFCVLDGRHFVPQHRERILIAGFRDETGFTFDDLQLPERGPRLGTILHPEDGSEEAEEPFTLGPKAKVNPKYVLTDKLWAYLQAYKEKHQAAGNGFGFGRFGPEDVARTLSARYYKDGSEILISRGKKNPRRLTPRECSRLMGFPPGYKIPVSDTQAYKQFGNSVVVPVIEAVAHHMRPHIMALKQFEETGMLQPRLVVGF